MDNKKRGELIKSYTQSMITLDRKIQEIEPDILVVPMMGSVPFIDAIITVNHYFDLYDSLYYIPASSSIPHVKNIIAKTLANILFEVIGESIDNEYKILSIDEVVSGGSLVKVQKGIFNGIRKYLFKTEQKEKNDLISFLSIGVEDERAKSESHPTYQKWKDEGRIISVGIKRIITMDDPELCPIKYVPYTNLNANYPNIEISVHPRYLKLLNQIAVKAGTDPNKVAPRNLLKIMEHQKYIPKEFLYK